MDKLIIYLRNEEDSERRVNEDSVNLTNAVVSLKKKIGDLENERNTLQSDIDSLKNKKIEEMSALLSLKSVHEKYQSSLLQLKIDVEKERIALDSLKKLIADEKKILDEQVSKSDVPPSKEKIKDPASMRIISKPLPLLTPARSQPPEPLNYKKYAASLNNKTENKDHYRWKVFLKIL